MPLSSEDRERLAKLLAMFSSTFTGEILNAEIDACMAKANFLTDWERGFLTSISDRWSLTEKQQARFDQIKAKVARYQDMDF